MTVKVVTVFESPRLPSHLATIGLYDPRPAPARRSSTAPTSPRSARAPPRRSRPTCSRARTPRTLAIVGAGVQGEHHLRTFPLVRDFDEIRISSLYRADAERRRGAAPTRARGRRPETAVARRGRRRARHPRRAAGDRAGLDRARARTSARSATARPTASCRARCSTRTPVRRDPRGVRADRRSAAPSCRAATRATRPSSARSCSAARPAAPRRRDHRLQGDGPRRRGHRRRRARLRRAPHGRGTIGHALARSLAMNLSRPALAVPPTLRAATASSRAAAPSVPSACRDHFQKLNWSTWSAISPSVTTNSRARR